MSLVYSRHANSHLVAWSANAINGIEGLSRFYLAEIDAALDFATTVDASLIRAFPEKQLFQLRDLISGCTALRASMNDAVKAHLTVLEQYGHLPYRIMHLPFNRTALMIETENFELQLEIRDRSVKVRSVQARPVPPDDGGTSSPAPKTPFWHRILASCHAGQARSDSRIAAKQDFAGYVRLATAGYTVVNDKKSLTLYERILSDARLWTSYYRRRLIEQLQYRRSTRPSTSGSADTGPCAGDATPSLLVTVPVEPWVQDATPAAWWQAAGGGTVTCLRVGPAFGADSRSFALVPVFTAYSGGAVFLNLDLDDDRCLDQFYLLMCGSLSRLRRDDATLPTVSFHVQCSGGQCLEGLGGAAGRTSGEILGALRDVFPVRMRFRRNNSAALVLRNIFEMTCRRTTIGVLADYFEEACRRVAQGEKICDAFLSGELPIAVAHVKTPEELSLICNVFSTDRFMGLAR